jgi:hypothetical protein
MRDDCSLELVAIAPTIQLFTGRMFGQPAVGDKTCNSGVTMICLQTLLTIRVLYGQLRIIMLFFYYGDIDEEDDIHHEGINDGRDSDDLVVEHKRTASYCDGLCRILVLQPQGW